MKTLFDYSYGFTSTGNRTYTSQTMAEQPTHVGFTAPVDRFRTPIPS